MHPFWWFICLFYHRGHINQQLSAFFLCPKVLLYLWCVMLWCVVPMLWLFCAPAKFGVLVQVACLREFMRRMYWTIQLQKLTAWRMSLRQTSSVSDVMTDLWRPEICSNEILCQKLWHFQSLVDFLRSKNPFFCSDSINFICFVGESLISLLRVVVVIKCRLGWPSLHLLPPPPLWPLKVRPHSSAGDLRGHQR